MKRLFFPALVSSALASGLISGVACDPKLDIVAPLGDAGSEASTTDAPVVQPVVEAGPAEEAGPSEGGTEAGVAEHAIDGVNDFAPGEKLATTSPGYDAYVSWDDTKVYFGMNGAAVGTALSTRWVLIYIDGVPGNSGSPTGIAYDCLGSCMPQQAHLPFNAGFHLQWKADGNYTHLQKWNGTTWNDVGPISTFARTGDFMEMSVVRTALGSPSKLKVHVNMLIEKAGEEWTFGGAPSTSFTDGPAPASFAHYFEFDLTDASKAPNTYLPK
ncbi:MAG: hypothetical protein JWO86_253 [Myxococcaceae bacterium]|jgi:hypothetical protein|nr:hypothetical protein [Myxococcaceae bacterium]MEA2753597.1 hypothetical protein [Myxococcales bacterium]